jgi:hypothetical protein
MKVAAIPKSLQFGPDGPSEPPIFRPVWANPYDRLFHVSGWDRLVRLDQDGVLQPLNADEVFDAEALDEHRVLAATGAGLRILDTDSLTYAPSLIPQPHWTVTQIARDGAGRIWLGGEGLWLLDGDRAHDFSASRCLGREITWMGGTSDKDAIAVSVDGRGGALFHP